MSRLAHSYSCRALCLEAWGSYGQSFRRSYTSTSPATSFVTSSASSLSSAATPLHHLLYSFFSRREQVAISPFCLTRHCRHFGSVAETQTLDSLENRQQISENNIGNNGSFGSSDNSDDGGDDSKKGDNRGGRFKTSSIYRGVSKQDKYWKATLYGNSISYYIGKFHDEEDAAKAYDRKAREIHGERARCNFDLNGSPVKMLSSKKRTYVPLDKPIVSLKTSRFLGVSFVNNRWLAKCTHDKKTIYLGMFNTDDEAAKAYDAKKRELAGVTARTNFDEEGNIRNDLVSVVKSREIVEKFNDDIKQKKLSRFRGVSYSFLKGKKWNAQIRKNGKLINLGSFDTEDEAAKAYDAKTRELNGVLAKPNFDESGKEINYIYSIDYYTKRRASAYRGVYLDLRKKSKMWRATIAFNKKSIYLGHHATQEEAAMAYDKKAREIYKEEASINFVNPKRDQNEDLP